MSLAVVAFFQSTKKRRREYLYRQDWARLTASTDAEEEERERANTTWNKSFIVIASNMYVMLYSVRRVWALSSSTIPPASRQSSARQCRQRKKKRRATEQHSNNLMDGTTCREHEKEKSSRLLRNNFHISEKVLQQFCSLVYLSSRTTNVIPLCELSSLSRRQSALSRQARRQPTRITIIVI